jgi:hypothetical protein
MGTRGFISFVADGQVKLGYNHSDSYPGWLGMNMLDWLCVADIASATQAVKDLRVVAPDSDPTAEDVERLARFHNPNVGGGRMTPDWYQLLRETQGMPGLILEAGVIEDASGFPADSLFAEWGYVVDFDGQAFEVYRGFQSEPHADGRFASETPNDGGYYPVRLVASWPFSALPDGSAFIEAAEGPDEGEMTNADVMTAEELDADGRDAEFRQDAADEARWAAEEGTH